MTTDDGPARSLEVELKFDADADTPLPDWAAVPQIASVGVVEVHDLDAQYFDTDDRALARSGHALRRRTGGPDAGWHIKGPKVDGAREELQWPLGEAPEIPPAVRAAVAEVVPDAASLTPLARIRNTRTAYPMLDAAGGVIAEFLDDRVIAHDERAGVERRWREWEFELGQAAPADPSERAALFAAVEDAVHTAGGREAASASKLARALGA